FPILLETIPELAQKGAYVLHGKKLVYTKKDVNLIVNYAHDRGVRVVPEIDMPAHTGSWAAAYKDITYLNRTAALPVVLRPDIPLPQYLHGEILLGPKRWENRYANEAGSGQLNPILPRTYEIVKKVIDEVTSLFPDSFYHVGGDEPLLKCWTDSPSVVEYQDKHKIGSDGLLNMFLQKVFGFVHAQKKTPIIWEGGFAQWFADQCCFSVHSPSDAVTTSNLSFSKDTILQIWTNTPEKAVKAGYKVIASNYNFWYLDCGHGGWNGNNTSYDQQEAPVTPPAIQKLLDQHSDWANSWAPSNWGGAGGDWCTPFKSWQRVYSYDLAYGLSKEEATNVLGGEVCLWSEQSDETTLDTKLWPRSSAAAEILWSGRYDADGVKRDIGDAMPRIFDWRYRLLARGIRAEPVQPLWCGQHRHMCDISYPAAFAK
ncbi:LOW QUALITY PROTEIN: glycoside hydrolase superfamily, partial [Jimgerdemannia flammicorona]